MKSIRLEATKYIWTGYAVIMGLMFGSAFFGAELGAGHVILGIAVTIATFLCTGSVWNWGSVKLESEFVEAEESSSEKAKRQHSRGIDRLLDQLSDDELLDLREDLRQRRFSSDGELLYREAKR